MSNRETTSRTRPTVTSSNILLGVTLITIALFLWAVPEMIDPTLVGIGGVLCLIVALWLIKSGVDSSLTALLAAALIVPAAVGLIGGTAIAALVVTSRLFPVPTSELVSMGSLLVLGHVGVFLGAVVAVLGTTLGRQGLLDTQVLDEFVSIGVLTGIVPMVTTVLYVVRAGGGDRAQGAPGFGDLHLSAVLNTVLSPAGSRLFLADSLILLSVATGVAAVALKLLPVAELLSDEGDGITQGPALRKVFYALVGISSVAGFVGVVALPVELLVSPRTFRTTLGPGLFVFIQGITTAETLRLLLTVLTAVMGLAAIGAFVARRATRDRARTILSETRYPDRKGPLAAGAVLTTVAIVVADSVFRTVVDGTARQLPETVAIELRDTANQSAAVYGEPTFVVLLTTILIASIVGLLLLLRISIGIGYLSGETTGYSLASAGVFISAAFGATIDVPLWLVFGGIVASLLIWDVGRFGTVLGREIGHQTVTRDVELVHAGATALVGLLAALIAAGVVTWLQGGLFEEAEASVVALLAVVIGLLSFASALR